MIKRGIMDPITWTVIGFIVAVGAGFGAGWGLKPDTSVEALKAQTEAIEALNAGNTALVEQVTATALIEEEKEALIADKLTDVPPQCLKELGGDPMSANCAWAWCVRTGETDKQRCEPSKLTDLIIEQYNSGCKE